MTLPQTMSMSLNFNCLNCSEDNCALKLYRLQIHQYYDAFPNAVKTILYLALKVFRNSGRSEFVGPGLLVLS